MSIYTRAEKVGFLLVRKSGNIESNIAIKFKNPKIADYLIKSVNVYNLMKVRDDITLFEIQKSNFEALLTNGSLILIEDMSTIQYVSNINTDIIKVVPIHKHNISDINELSVALGGKLVDGYNLGTGETSVVKSILKDKADGALKFKQLEAGSNVTFNTTDDPDKIRISSSGGGGGTTVHNDLTSRDAINCHPTSSITNLDTTLSGKIDTGTQLGTGHHVFAQKVGTALAFKSLIAGTNVTLSSDANGVTVNSTGSGGVTVHNNLTSRDVADCHPLSAVTGLSTALGTKVETASNVGTGVGLIFKSKTLVDLALKTIKAGSNVTITNNTDDVTIASTGSGGVTVHNDLTSRDASDCHPTSAITGLDTALSGKASTSHTHATSEVTGLDTALGTKVETYSSLGAGSSIIGTKSGVNLPFKSLVAGTNIILTPDANTITIESTGGSSGGSLMYATTSTSMQSMNVNTIVHFDTVYASRGSNISLNTGTYTFTLAANKFYEMTVRLDMVYGNATSLADFKFYNVTTSAYFGLEWLKTPTNRSDMISYHEDYVFILPFNPLVSTQIQLKCSQLSLSASVVANSIIVIKEL